MNLSVRKKQLWLSALVGTWALGIVYVFWFFMFKDLRVFAEETDRFARFSQAVAEQVSEQISLLGKSTQLIIMWVSDAITVEGISGISSPSAVIIDGSGNVLYSGPFSDGALCNADGDTPVEIMLDEINEKDSVSPWLNISSFGCYCNWPQ
ncbi:MAG: DUF6436 domain-containing protein [Halomonas sp.]|nr:DUF6436 domain-containing protein [Halomonas sp.]